MIVAALCLSACEERQPPAPEKAELPEEAVSEVEVLLEPFGFADLPGWSEDPMAPAIGALRRSCARLLRKDPEAPVGPKGLGGKVADWREPCTALAEVAAGDHASSRAYFEAWFRPFRVVAEGSDQGVFTGYYEAELKGDLRPNGRYRVPLFKRPDDLVSVDLGQFRADLEGEKLLGRVENNRLVPYFDRRQIDDGALRDRGLELLWADDPVDVFFLHVQGSGRVTLPDGQSLRVGFAASNGLPFYAIGRALIQEKLITGKVSMQAIRDWLRDNPEKAQEVMQRNARYIFFRKIEGEGPIGAQGVALTAERSLAVDPAFIPLGAPLFLDTTWPATEKPLRRLMIAQDTGNAIKGPVRGDFFWGFGEAALAQAGRMKQSGRYFLLLPRAVAQRREKTS